MVVFLDRDGVINANRAEHVTSWSDFQFLPGALDGLRLLALAGHEVVLVTNQAIVGHGLLSRSKLDALHRRMLRAIADHGGRVSTVLVCPHRPEENCACRKPAPGLLLAAAQRLSLDVADTVLVGDHPTDLQAAERAGCRSILVLSGRQAEPPGPEELPPGCMAVVPDLLAAARALTGGSPGC